LPVLGVKEPVRIVFWYPERFIARFASSSPVACDVSGTASGAGACGGFTGFGFENIPPIFFSP
jgi:hypothetical protein